MRATSARDRARIIAALDAVEGGEAEDGTVRLDAHVALHVSHLRKRFFSEAQVTKGDLMRYYVWASPYLLPLLRDRPLALKRFPDGIDGDAFFQQKAPDGAPSFVRVQTLTNEAGERQPRVIGGSLATLLYCVQLGTIEMNPWHARVRSVEHPDYTVLDLDPGPETPFEGIVEAALWIKEALDRYGLTAAVKTSGSRGLHIFIPLAAGVEEGDAARVSERIAVAVATAHPRATTVRRAIRGRGATRVYLDAGQNARGKTVAAAYSVRPKPGATVSTPLAWGELTASLDPHDFTIHTVPDRVNAVGDLWAPTMHRPNPERAVTKV